VPSRAHRVGHPRHLLLEPLERFVMELFRTISPNGGSISALQEVRTPLFERHGYVVSPHSATSLDPVLARASVVGEVIGNAMD
jgi:hypothetical protein